jgi:RNA-binding protein YlmH
MLPRAELLQGSHDPVALAGVLAAADQALRTWQPCWSDFLDGGVLEEAERRLGSLAELESRSEGGYPGAERRRLVLARPWLGWRSAATFCLIRPNPPTCGQPCSVWGCQ